ncbi:MAG: RNase P subunit p30 family protein [Candidatus Woesearchaeota archaeon]
MYCDIVFPKNNEREFLQVARFLGYEKLVFVYETAPINIPKENGAVVVFGASTKQKPKWAEYLILESTGDDRKTIETLRPEIIYGFETKNTKDGLHYRNSGLNHVLCALMRENNVACGFSLSALINHKNRQVLLGRMKQNIRLCRKFGVKQVIASFSDEPMAMRAPRDIISLFVCLGMESGEIKNALRCFQK